jgi:hypothetical protein
MLVIFNFLKSFVSFSSFSLVIGCLYVLSKSHVMLKMWLYVETEWGYSKFRICLEIIFMIVDSILFLAA